MDWFFYSDVSSQANEVENLLLQKHHDLNIINMIEDIYPILEQSQQSVLFIKTHTNSHIYQICQEVSLLYPHVYIILIVPDKLENFKRAIDVGAADLLRTSSKEGEILEVIKQAEHYMKCCLYT